MICVIFFYSLNVKGKLKNMRKFEKNEKSAAILNVAHLITTIMHEYISTRKSIDKSPINLKRKQSCPFKVIIKYFFYLHIKQLFLNFILLVVILILKI